MSKTTEGMSESASELLELARKKFCNLNEAEEKLFHSIADGEVADYSAEKEKDNDPVYADKWGRERVLDADRIAWLCTDKLALELVTHRGVQIKGAYIKGNLDLSYSNISFPLVFENSAVPGGINLRHAEIFHLDIKGTHTGQLNAYGLRVAHDLYLRNGFKTEAEVRLSGAIIGGTLDCDKGQFLNADGIAIRADRMKVEGGVYLRKDFTARGEVCMRGSTIGEALHCDKGQFIKAKGVALRADRLKVEGDVFLRKGFKAKGEVRMTDATIGGVLDCSGGQFINKRKRKKALNADSLNVGGNVFLRNGFKAEGEVSLHGATIGEELHCDRGKFVNADGVALRGDRLKVGGGVFLHNHFKADGEVNLFAATIGGNLDCSGGQFINPNGIALMANSLYVKQNAIFRCIYFKVEGEVSLVNAKINGFFYWMCLFSTEDVRVDLRSANIGTLRDEEKSWPEKDELLLHGLLYDEIHNTAPRDAKRRIVWLRRQSGFWPQPYEQLAAVLSKGGQDEDARKVLITKNEDKAELAELTTRSEKIWYNVLGPMIGYGYRPLNALWGMLVFVVLGWILFGIGYWGRLITPPSESAYVERSIKTVDSKTKSRELSDVYPKFNFLVYSVDTFVPLIDLHQSKYWHPNANRGYELLSIKGFSLHTGGLLRLYLWIHIVMGWLLSTLLVVGVTGLVRT